MSNPRDSGFTKENLGRIKERMESCLARLLEAEEWAEQAQVTSDLYIGLHHAQAAIASVLQRIAIEQEEKRGEDICECSHRRDVHRGMRMQMGKVINEDSPMCSSWNCQCLAFKEDVRLPTRKA